MSRYQWSPPNRQISFDNMKIGSADATGSDPNEQFIVSRHGQITFYKLQWARLHGGG
jgi:hypothetical protein